MPSTFFGLDIGKTGLYAASVGINTAANNISNEKSEGYSRQVITQQARTPLNVYSRYGLVGAGTEVTSVTRVRDIYYDNKYRYNNAKLAEQSDKYTYNLQIEDYFNEMQTEGFTSTYTEMFATLKQLNGTPDDSTLRIEFLNYAQSMSEYMNNIQTKLTKLQQEANMEVSNSVDQINTYTDQIASLNKQINMVEMAGGTANELRDQRDLALDKLSKIVPVNVNETKYEGGKSDYLVKIGNLNVVQNYDSNKLTAVSRETLDNSYDAVGLYDIYCFYDNETGTGTKFNVQMNGLSGQLRGVLDIRDGNNADAASGNSVSYKGIPYYLNKLQDFKQALADAFNSVHSNGIDLYGNSTADVPIFEISATGEMNVNKNLIADPSLMATTKNPLQDGIGDSSLIDDFAALKDKKILNNSTASSYLEGMIGEISVSTQKSQLFENNYTNIVNTIDTQRKSISGVDGDEETMNLEKYQESYQLCSRIISVMSQCYDKLINETGV